MTASSLFTSSLYRYTVACRRERRCSRKLRSRRRHCKNGTKVEAETELRPISVVAAVVLELLYRWYSFVAIDRKCPRRGEDVWALTHCDSNTVCREVVVGRNTTNQSSRYFTIFSNMLMFIDECLLIIEKVTSSCVIVVVSPALVAIVVCCGVAPNVFWIPVSNSS